MLAARLKPCPFKTVRRRNGILLQPGVLGFRATSGVRRSPAGRPICFKTAFTLRSEISGRNGDCPSCTKSPCLRVSAKGIIIAACWRRTQSGTNSSPPKFPANREKYREFRLKTELILRTGECICLIPCHLCQLRPLRTLHREQGIIEAISGNRIPCYDDSRNSNDLSRAIPPCGNAKRDRPAGLLVKWRCIVS